MSGKNFQKLMDPAVGGNMLVVQISLTLLLACPATAEIKRFHHRHYETELEYTFDNSRISEQHLKRYLIIHPYAYDWNYLVSHLNLCVDGEPGYQRCGSRDIRDPNFLKNAAVNIDKARAKRRYLDTLTEIEILEPLVRYFKKSLEFSLVLDERLYEYFQTWNPELLKRKVEGIDPVKVAPEIISALERSQSKLERYDLAHQEWRNAMNSVFREDLGEMPEENWNRFLQAFGIEEANLTSPD